jgi:hypothetical protein
MGFWSGVAVKLDKAAHEERDSRAAWEKRLHEPQEVASNDRNGPSVHDEYIKGLPPPSPPMPTPRITSGRRHRYKHLIWLYDLAAD